MSKRRVVATGKLTNDGTGTVQKGNYVAQFSYQERPNHVWKYGSVSGFRRDKKNVWYLLRMCLNTILPGE